MRVLAVRSVLLEVVDVAFDDVVARLVRLHFLEVDDLIMHICLAFAYVPRVYLGIAVVLALTPCECPHSSAINVVGQL